MVCHDGGLATSQDEARRNSRSRWDGRVAFKRSNDLLKWSYTRNAIVDHHFRRALFFFSIDVLILVLEDIQYFKC